MTPSKAFTILLFAFISFNQGKHPNGVSLFVGGLPIPTECKDDAMNSPQLNASYFCPTLQSMDNLNQPKCLTQGDQKCSESSILGVGISTNVLNKMISPGPCTNYILITSSVFNNIISSLCLSINTTSIQLVFRTCVNDSSCILNIQQYNYTDQGKDCDILEQKANSVSYFPWCSQVPFYSSNEQSLIEELEVNGLKKLEIKAVSGWKSLKEQSPLPISVHSKTTEVRRVERGEGIRRVRKPIHWNWRDHVLEITVASIVAGVLLLIGLKKCLSDTLPNINLHSRVVRFDLEEVAEKRRRFSNCLSSPQRRRSQIDFNRNPSKPILKNKNKPRSPLNRVLLTQTSAIQSFDSNSSIYYDALEGPFPAEICLPLVSEF